MALNTTARTLVEILLDSNNKLTYIYINMSTLKLDVKNVLVQIEEAADGDTADA